MTFGERLKLARERRGLSLRDLARLTKMNPGYLSRIEAGKHPRLSIDTVKLLAKTLAVTADWLVGMYEDQELDIEATGLVGAAN